MKSLLPLTPRSRQLRDEGKAVGSGSADGFAVFGHPRRTSFRRRRNRNWGRLTKWDEHRHHMLDELKVERRLVFLMESDQSWSQSSPPHAAGPKYTAITSSKDGRGRTNPTADKIRNTAHSMRMANNGRSRSLRRDRGLEVTSSTGPGHLALRRHRA